MSVSWVFFFSFCSASWQVWVGLHTCYSHSASLCIWMDCWGRHLFIILILMKQQFLKHTYCMRICTWSWDDMTLQSLIHTTAPSWHQDEIELTGTRSKKDRVYNLDLLVRSSLHKDRFIIHIDHQTNIFLPGCICLIGSLSQRKNIASYLVILDWLWQRCSLANVVNQ